MYIEEAEGFKYICSLSVQYGVVVANNYVGLVQALDRVLHQRADRDHHLARPATR
jgi:hypothetical protein